MITKHATLAGWSLKLVAIAALVIATDAANAVSTSEIDEINAGIRARAAAAKGQPPQEVHLSGTNGTTMSADRADLIKSGKCSFSYYVLGDKKGKALATEASKECLDSGGDRGEAYERSMEHRQLTKRSGSVNQMQQQQMKWQLDDIEWNQRFGR